MTKAWKVTAVSLNDLRGYEVNLEPGVADSEDEARKLFTETVVGHVKAEFQGAVAGIPWLPCPDTIACEQVPHQDASGSVDFDVFQNLRIASALALEIRSGLKVGSQSVMNVARDMCGSAHRRKLLVLKDYVEWLAKWFQENHPDLPAYTPNPYVRRALEEVPR